VSEKRPSGSPFFHQGAEGTTPSTLRSIEVAEEIAPDTEQELAPVYVEPQPLPALSDHKTIEIQTVKLADDIDPRKLPTELRLVRPPSVPPPDSEWPYSEAALAATQPPFAERRRSRARVFVAALFALLLLGSGLAFRKRASSANVEPGSSAMALASAAPPAATAIVQPSAPGLADSASAPAADLASAAPSASAVVNVADLPLSSSATEPAPKPRHHAATHVAAKTSATPEPPHELAPPSPSKPKRAIY